MRIYQSWDTVSKPDEHYDYTVCTIWGVHGDNLYLLDVHHGQYDFLTVKRKVIELAVQWDPTAINIEEKGSVTALIQQLRYVRNGIPYPTAFMPMDDKLTRLHTQSVVIEAGHVYLPEQAPWRDAFRTELASFPNGRHDEQVDSTSQFLAWHSGRRLRGTQIIPLGVSELPYAGFRLSVARRMSVTLSRP